MERGIDSPIQMVRFLRSEILRKTGRRPVKLSISKDVYRAWIRHPEVLDRVKYGGFPVETYRYGIPPVILANVLGVEEIELEMPL